MPYSTLTDLKNTLNEKILLKLTNEVPGGTTIVQAKIDAAIKKADSDIDLFTGKRYTVPFNPVPDAVNGWSIDIAIYFLYSNSSEKLPLVRKEYHDRAKARLKKIFLGEMDIPGIVVDEGFQAENVSSTHFSTATEFTAQEELIKQQ